MEDVKDKKTVVRIYSIEPRSHPIPALLWFRPYRLAAGQCLCGFSAGKTSENGEFWAKPELVKVPGM